MNSSNNTNRADMEPVFFQDGDVLPLTEIVKTKKIVSVTISYQSKKQAVPVRSLWRLLGLKKVVQEKRVLIINDQGGITFTIPSTEAPLCVRFSEKSEFEKLTNDQYCETTLRKKRMSGSVQPYNIFFSVKSLEDMKWE